MGKNCDCIIPFYNEETRVDHVVESVLKVSNLTKIIVVDDGSDSDEAYVRLKAKFPQVTAARLGQNTGKANAVKEGLKFVTAKYVLLLDGDLTNIKTFELENAINKMIGNPAIDMIIFKRTEDKTRTAWLRWDIVVSGQRILRKSDLEKVFATEKDVEGYQLEAAINAYMIEHNKTAYWMPLSIHNRYKFDKWGPIEGVKIGTKNFFTYAGYKNMARQTLFFCREEAP